MTRDEAAKILAVLKAAYPGFYRDITRQDAISAVALWSAMFETEPYELVVAAVKTFIASDEKGFPPHIGAIKAKIRLLRSPDELTDGEAWWLVKKAVKSGDKSEAFNALPDAVKRVVGGPSQLRDWGMMDIGEFNSVVQSNFMRSYRAVVAAEKEKAAIPESVIKLIGNTAALELEA